MRRPGTRRADREPGPEPQKQRRGRERRPQDPQQVRKRQTLRWKLTVFALLVLACSGFVTVLVYYILLRLLETTPLVAQLTLNPIFAAVVLLCSCGILTTVLFAWFSKYYLRPVKQIVAATKEIRRGNFAARVPSEVHPETEMGGLIRNFNEMARELEGTELFRNDFINNFSHEFKTPIVSIRGFARELQHTDLTAAQRQEYARIIEEEADRLARLASNVLELSKLENQQIVTNRTVFYLDEQIRQCILALEREWTAKDLEILPDLEEVRYEFDEEMLALVWRNLLGNAIKFTPPGGQIRVKLRAEGTELRVTVADTGIGMKPEVCARVFDKFFQGDPSHSKQGYGVGLAIVRRVVTLTGGSVSVTSTPGHGSCFTVLLPR